MRTWAQQGCVCPVGIPAAAIAFVQRCRTTMSHRSPMFGLHAGAAPGLLSRDEIADSVPRNFSLLHSHGLGLVAACRRRPVADGRP